MSLQILENEALVLKKIRAMAGCKFAEVTVIRNYDITIYLMYYAGYEFDLITNTSNTMPLAFISAPKGCKYTNSSYTYQRIATPNTLADKKFIESDFVYVSSETIVYSLDSVRVIVENLNTRLQDYQAYQSRPIKALQGVIKSRKGVVSWGVSLDKDELYLISDLGSLILHPKFSLKESKLELLSVIAGVSSVTIDCTYSRKNPVFKDKLLEAMDVVGYCQDKLAVYKPKKGNGRIQLFTVVA